MTKLYLVRYGLAATIVTSLLLLLTSLPSMVSGEQIRAHPPKYDEQVLKRRYDAFMADLDYVKVASDYPTVIRDLLSGNSELQVKAVRSLGETGAPQVIPWIVPFLDSEDGALRVWAGSSIERVISDSALKRRDRTHADKIVLRPLEVGELDLRPLAWIALKMFRKPDDGNTHAYAASITGHLEIKEFEDELRRCLNSKHPAVSDKARWALESLGFAISDQTAQPFAPAVKQEQRPYEGMITTADAVVAVEILSTDYTATPADGPMVAVAKALKILKGPFTRGKQFRFTETAWVGPTYQKGECRILFLEKATSTETPGANQWRILSNLCAKGDFFIEKDAIPDLSLESLESFLKKIQDSGNKSPKVIFNTSQDGTGFFANAAELTPLPDLKSPSANDQKRVSESREIGMAGMVASGSNDQTQELDRVVVGLQPIIATLAPIPEVKTNDQSSLTISYRAQTFKIHGGSMTGEFSREAHDEIGPTFKGFVLFIEVQPQGEVNQADTPQTIRRPYWQTYLQVTPVAESDKQLYWGLSYGSQTDTNLLAQIRQAIEGLKDKPNQPPSVQRKVDAQPSGLMQDDVRRLAIDFKRKWLQENPAEIEQIGLANIREMKRTDTGWHILFEQIRFHGQPEGESHHFLHIYIDAKGKLEKVVRGPDVIT